MDGELLNLAGRNILLTGGCGALGRAIASTLERHGACVAVNDILPEDEAALLLPASDSVCYVKSDSSSPALAGQLIDRASEALGAMPDTVLCHAGVVRSHAIETFPEDVFDHIIDVNLRSSFFVAQASSRAWRAKESGGHLIFTSSWVAETPWPGVGPYSASKAAINALMRSFAREMAPYAIRSNAVAPGIVAAGMAQHQWDTEADYRKRAGKAIPLGRLQDLESVANSLLFLCSPMANYMTGAVLTVDGGCSLYPMD